MFSVYESQGRVFRNTLEELYRVEKIRAVDGLKPVKKDKQQEPEPSGSYYTNEAIKAYREAISVKHDTAIYHAYQIMKRPVVTVFENTPLLECYALLEEKGFKQVPVLTMDSRPIGMLSRDKLLGQLVFEGGVLRQAGAATIRELMGEQLFAADPLTDIRRVAKLMYDWKLNCIPITNEADIFVGIITRTDIVYAVSIFPALTLWA